MFYDLRDTSQHFLMGFHHWSYLTPWSPLITQIFLFPYIDNHRNTSFPLLRVFIIQAPPKQHISALLRVFIIEAPQPRSREDSPNKLLYSSFHETWRSS